MSKIIRRIEQQLSRFHKVFPNVPAMFFKGFSTAKNITPTALTCDEVFHIFRFDHSADMFKAGRKRGLSTAQIEHLLNPFNMPKETLEGMAQEVLENSTANYCLLNWSLTKRIYSLDTDLASLITEDSDKLGGVTLDVLEHLPEYGLCVQTDFVANGNQYLGFMCSFSKENDTFFDIPSTELGLRDTTNHLVISAISEDPSQDYKFRLSMDYDVDSTLKLAVDRGEICKNGLSIIGKILPIIVYCCSQNFKTYSKQNPYYTGEAGNSPKSRFIPPQKINTYKVGQVDGDAIRSFNVEKLSYEHTGRHVRPHIRRAHWHSFWTGSHRDPELRKKVIKFIPHTFVNVDINPSNKLEIKNG